MKKKSDKLVKKKLKNDKLMKKKEKKPPQTSVKGDKLVKKSKRKWQPSEEK